jgi:hypothetical protein
MGRIQAVCPLGKGNRNLSIKEEKRPVFFGESDFFRIFSDLVQEARKDRSKEVPGHLPRRKGYLFYWIFTKSELTFYEKGTLPGYSGTPCSSALLSLILR